MSSLFVVLALLGACVLAAGAILFFASNWSVMPRWVRVTWIALAVVGAYVAAWPLMYGRRSHPRVGEAVLLLGAMLYGAGLWLIAQIFHVGDPIPIGMLLWSAGALPMAWAARSRALTILVLLAATFWSIGEITQASFAPAGSYLVLFLPAVLVAYRTRSRAAVVVAVLCGSLWLLVQAGLAMDKRVFLLVPALGATLFLTGVLHEVAGRELSRHAGSFKLIGTILTFAGLLVSGSGEILHGVLGHRVTPAWVQPAVGLMISAGMGALLWQRVQRPWSPRARAFDDSWARGRLVVGTGVLVYTLAASVFGPDAVVPLSILNNLVLIGVLVAAIAHALHEGERAQLVIALVAAAGLILFRYFDMFFGLMPRSLFFIGIGGLMLLSMVVAVKVHGRATAGKEAA